MQVRERRVVYGCSTVDANGRISDRVVFAALEWVAGTRLDIRESGGLVVVSADRQGVFRMNGRERLFLPATARQWCRLATGDRVMLAADAVDGRLIVYPPAVLDEMIVRSMADTFGGAGR